MLSNYVEYFFQMVRLLASSEVEVEASKLRAICRRSRRDTKPGVCIVRKLIILLFSTEELAQSRGQGIGRCTKGDLRPPLSPAKIQALKGFFFKVICYQNAFQHHIKLDQMINVKKIDVILSLKIYNHFIYV